MLIFIASFSCFMEDVRIFFGRQKNVKPKFAVRVKRCLDRNSSVGTIANF